jgi:anaerobic magnesium-protoporphyrin IX monomethyl ester cyclase
MPIFRIPNEDDNFTHDPARYDKILDVFLSLKIKIKWDTPNGIRGDVWNLEQVKKTKESGCQYLIVAVESGVQRVLDKVVKKRLDLKKVEVLMKACDQVHLQLFAFFLTGLPGETKKEIGQTVDFALSKFKQYNVMPTLNLAIPLPGTEFHDNIVENNLYEGKLEYSTNKVITDEFDKDVITSEYSRWRKGVFKIALIKSFTNFRMLRLFFS